MIRAYYKFLMNDYEISEDFNDIMAYPDSDYYYISVRALQNQTGLNKRQQNKEISELVDMGIIYRFNSKYTDEISVNEGRYFTLDEDIITQLFIKCDLL